VVAEIALGAGSELVAALAVVEDLDGALQTPGAEQVTGSGKAPAIAGRYIASWVGAPRLFGVGRAAILGLT
jgi:hypothetical protein